MKLRIIIFLLVMVLIFSHGASAKEVTEDIGTLKLKFDNRFNSGRDLNLKVQVNFNISILEIIIDRDNDSITVYFSQVDNWYPGDWAETNVQSELIEESYEYQGRIIAYPQNRNLTVVTHFFNFKVLEVLDINQTIGASSILAMLFLIPFIYTKDRERVEFKLWNRISLVGYLKYYPSKLWCKKGGLVLLLITLLIIGGFYLVTELQLYP